MAFQGSLAELHLPDIIQLISVSGKTGVFHLADGELKGEIFLADGQIVHAQVEDVSGEEAVYALAIWRQGEFKFEPGADTELRTISKSNTNLLMEAARRLDEWRVLSKKIPSADLIPQFVVQDNRDGQINLNTSEWLILSKIDGRRSIKQIGDACGLTVFDASKVLYGLIATGLIKLHETAEQTVEARPAARPTPAPPPAAATGSPDLLEKLDKMRDVCNGLLGSVGESVVSKHYAKARAEIAKGAGFESIEEAISQITRAASILKGPSVSETLLEKLKSLR